MKKVVIAVELVCGVKATRKKNKVSGLYYLITPLNQSIIGF